MTDKITHNHDTEAEIIERLTEDIKKKKEFSSLDSEYVKKILNQALNKNQIGKLGRTEKLSEIKNYKQFTRSSFYEKIIKTTRSLLRKKYGLYKKESEEKIRKEITELANLIKEEGLRSNKSLSQTNKILSMHLSTKERIPFYSVLYDEIWEVTGKPKSILDLGCGLNPVSFPYMNLDRVEYFANEMSDEDCGIISSYFKEIKEIKGKVNKQNLLEVEKYNFPKVDVCFIFKTLDVLEQDERDISLKILDKVCAKWFVLSFATKSVGGRKIISSWKWVEKKIPNIVKKLEFENEVFFIVRAD